MAGRFTLPTPSAYDSSGNPLAGGKLEFYESGTSTPLDTYSDDDLSVANANPVVADSAGRWGDIFLKEQDYKVILKDSSDVTIDTWDPVRAAEPISTAVTSKTTTYTVTTSDNGKLIKADATSSPFTITLPAVADAGNGFEVGVKKIDSSANAVTVDADGSETIDGASDVSLPNQHDTAWFRCDGTGWQMTVVPLTADRIPLPLDYIAGLAHSINGTDTDHDLDTAAGVARDDGDSVNIVLESSITKRMDSAWAVGGGNGGLDTGTVAASSVYYRWLIRRSDTGVVDVLYSLSSTSPTMPASYDQKAGPLGSHSTDSSANTDQLWNREGFPDLATPLATTSGTSFDFIGIPSWVTKLDIIFSGVSLSGTDDILIQLGDGGGIEATGYTSTCVAVTTGPSVAQSTSTAGFICRLANASNVLRGTVSINLAVASSFTWEASGVVLTGSVAAMTAGEKALSAALDRIRVTRTGTDTFDAGSINIRYS